MLQSIRENSQGWLAWLVVGLISIPFALWGVNSYLEGGTNVSVAKVNGTDIGLNQYQRALQNYQERLRQVFGDQFDINNMDQASIKQDVIAGLVDQQVLKDAGQNAGMRVSNEQVTTMIKSMDFFHDESGNFSNLLYERKLIQIGRSPAEFEQQLRNDMVQEQLQMAVMDSEFVTKSEETKIAQFQAQTRNIVYTTIASDTFEKDIVISEDEVAAFYDENKESYKTEESTRIKYIDLSIDELAKQIELEDADLESYYQENLDKYTFAERRVADHILVALAPDSSAEKVAEAKASAGKLLELVKTGVEFDDIPQEHADLLGAQDEVGKTGAVTQGTMDPEFDEVLFELQVGDLSEIVRSKRGYHIIKLAEIKESKITGFDEAKESIETEFRKEQAEAKFFDIADELQNLTYENQDSLEVAADTLGFEIHETESFTRSEGDEFTRNPAILNAAFSEKVVQGANSDPVELAEDHLVVLRSFEHKIPEVKELALVKEEIRSTLLNQATKQKAETTGNEILAQLNAGDSLESIATEFNVEWHEAESVVRDDANVKRSILRNVFKLGRPSSDDKPVYKGFTDGLSDYAIVGVTAVIDADIEWTGASEDATKSIEQMQQQRTTDAWQDFLSMLKQNADIELNSSAL